MLDASLRFSLFWNLSVLIFLLWEILSFSRRRAAPLNGWGLLRWYDLLVGNAVFILLPVITTGLSDRLDVPASQPANMMALPVLYFMSQPVGLNMHSGLMRVVEALLLVLMK